VTTTKELEMPLEKDSAAVAAAKAVVAAGDEHDYDALRAALADDVRLTMIAADPAFPKTELNGVEAYMQSVTQFKDAVVPGSTRVTEGIGDDRQALLRVNAKVKFGLEAPVLDAISARMYVLNEQGKIQSEHVLFLAT
jgi:hypothetical protein